MPSGRGTGAADVLRPSGPGTATGLTRTTTAGRTAPAATTGLSLAGLTAALALLSLFSLAIGVVSPDRQLGLQATFAVALNAGVVAGLSLLPSRRQLPSFLLLVELFSVVIRLPTISLAAAVSITLANLPALVVFRVLALRYADGGRHLDLPRHLVRLLACALATAAVSAVGAAVLTRLAAASALITPDETPPLWFIFGTRLAAQFGGLVTFTPLVLLLMRRPPRFWSARTWAETGGWLVVLVTAGVLAHQIRDGVQVGPLALLAGFATLVFAVLRCGSLAAAVLTPAFAMTAAVVIMSAEGANAGRQVSSVLFSQAAALLAALLAWTVSASVAQREAARQWAQARQASTEALVTLQAALLPPSVTSSPTVTVAARYRVASEQDQVGGDWYDMIALPGGDTALVIGDVEGHDLTAASVMALVRGAVRSYALQGHPPAIVLEDVNGFLASSGIERLVTMAYVQLYRDAALATVAVAGHPPPVIVPTSGPAVPLPTRPGPLLGLDSLTGWQEQTLGLPSASRLVLYTDGLEEALITAATGEPPAEAGSDVVTRRQALAEEDGVEALAEALISRAGSHDDAAVLVARPERPDERRVQRTLPALPISAGVARTWLTDVYALWQARDASASPHRTDACDDDRLQVAQLLLTELMSNAIRHTDRWVTVRLQVREERLRIGVHDGSDRLPVLRQVDETAREGRGLRLVNTLAADWGVELEPQGKTVWFELAPAGGAAVDEDALIAAFAEPLVPDLPDLPDLPDVPDVPAQTADRGSPGRAGGRDPERRDTRIGIETPLLPPLFEGAAVALVSIDVSGKVMAVSAAAEALLGYDEAELLGATFHQRVHYQRQDGTPLSIEACPLEQAIRTARPASNDEDAFTTKEGTILAVSWTVSPTVIAGETTGAIVAFYDKRPVAGVQVRRPAGEATSADDAGIRLALLADTSHALISASSLHAGLDQVAQLLVPSAADWVVIDLLDEHTAGIERAALAHRDADLQARGLRRLGPLPGLQPEMTDPLAVVLRGGPTMHLTDFPPPSTATDELSAARLDLFHLLGTAEAIIAPMRTRTRTVGAITLVRHESARPAGAADMQLADGLASRLAFAVENARLLERYERRSETLQQALLPVVPERLGDVRLAHRYRPNDDLNRVGGDWYDAFELPDGSVALVIGDVAGHDVQAATQMGAIRHKLRALALDRLAPPSEVLARLDAVVRALNPDELTTLIYAQLIPPEPASRPTDRPGRWRLHWSTAGHPPPLLITPGAPPRFLSADPDPPIGVHDRVRTDRQALLDQGSTVILYTDGLVERHDEPVDVGLARLLQRAIEVSSALPARDGTDVEALPERLLDLVRAPAADDIAILVVTLPDR